MALIIGKQECSVDDKRRFSLPPKFRNHFPGRQSESRGQPAILMPWYQGALALMPEPSWNRLENRIALLDTSIPNHMQRLNLVLARAERVESDPEGRFTMTPEQCEWLRLTAGKKGRVVLAGQGRHLVVWNAEEYSNVQRAGTNPVQRETDDLAYEKALEELMTLSREAAEDEERRAREAAGAPEAES